MIKTIVVFTINAEMLSVTIFLGLLVCSLQLHSVLYDCKVQHTPLKIVWILSLTVKPHTNIIIKELMDGIHTSETEIEAVS